MLREPVPAPLHQAMGMRGESGLHMSQSGTQAMPPPTSPSLACPCT